jgi:hypothetical protein
MLGLAKDIYRPRPFEVVRSSLMASFGGLGLPDQR